MPRIAARPVSHDRTTVQTHPERDADAPDHRHSGVPVALTIQGVITDDAEQILLLQPESDGAPDGKVWSLPGTDLVAGWTPAETLRVYLGEQLGLYRTHLDEAQFCFRHTNGPCDDSGPVATLLFDCGRLSHADVQRAARVDGPRIRWTNRDDLEHLLHPAELSLLRSALRHPPSPSYVEVPIPRDPAVSPWFDEHSKVVHTGLVRPRVAISADSPDFPNDMARLLDRMRERL